MRTTDGHKKRRSWRPRVVIPLCVIVLVIVLVVVSTSRNTTVLTQITEQRRQEYYRDDGTTSATPPSPLPLPPPPPPRATIHRTDDVAIRDDPEPQTSSFLFPKTTTTDLRPSALAVLTRLRRGSGDDCTPNPNQSLQRVVESTTFAEYANATTRFFHLSSSSSAAAAAAPKNTQPKTPTPTHHSFSSSVLEDNDDNNHNHNNNRNNNVHPIFLTCEYMAQQAHSKHFAHAMQQLYGCYSYFQLERSVSSITGGSSSSSSDISTPNNSNNNYKPRMVLLLTTKVRRQLESNAFLKGFLQLLQNPMGVEIMSRTMYLEQQQQQHTTTTTATNSSSSSSSVTDTHNEEIRATSIWVPGGYVLSHSIELHHMVQQRYNWTAVDSCSSGGHNDDDDDDSGIRMPRIGILNRRKSSGRSILNVDLLGRELASILHKHNNNNNHDNNNNNNNNSNSNTTTNTTNTNTKVGTSNKHHPNVVIEYFEGGSKSFQDQVSFFQSIDVLISPHGAQLTGLPFLGSSAGSSSCRQLLELFPPDYLIPAFYGSLARNANIGYNYLYLKSNNNNNNETTTTTADRNSQQQQQQQEAATDSSSLQGRIQARAANLCPSPNVILESVQELIASFRQCCDARTGE